LTFFSSQERVFNSIMAKSGQKIVDF
jgi:hypothetical protein